MKKIGTVDLPGNIVCLQRLEFVKRDSITMGMIVQRVADGETLKEIAKDWQIPHGLFYLWIMGSHDRMQAYKRALKVRADQEIHAALKNANSEYVMDKSGKLVLDKEGRPISRDVRWARLQVATSFKAAEKWDRERFGPREAKQDVQSISDDGVGELPRRLAGAFEARDNLPGLINKTPIDVR
ncbi:MAG: hypothetical protein BGO99_10575 [Nitrosospira sp. 56-18]|mgnify:FL=1|nr:MAG: hypothetical protein BGO99_10575 [Nitrosospira sp. 56-18]